VPSIGSPCAAHTQSPQRPVEAEGASALPQVYADTSDSGRVAASESRAQPCATTHLTRPRMPHVVFVMISYRDTMNQMMFFVHHYLWISSYGTRKYAESCS
jgi:hypothetical protein